MTQLKKATAPGEVIAAANRVREWLRTQAVGSSVNGVMSTGLMPQDMPIGRLLKGLVLAVGQRGTVRVPDSVFKEVINWHLVVREDDNVPGHTVFWVTPKFEADVPVTGNVVSSPEIISGDRTPFHLVDVSLLLEYRQLLAAAIGLIPGRRLRVPQDFVDAIDPKIIHGGLDGKGMIDMSVPAMKHVETDDGDGP